MSSVGVMMMKNKASCFGLQLWFSNTIAALVADNGYLQSKLIGKMMSRAANIHKILIRKRAVLILSWEKIFS